MPSNGRFNFPYNAVCNCYRGQVTVYAYNGTGSDVYSPNLVVGRVYTSSPTTTYSAPANTAGNQREFILKSIDAVSNGSVTLNGMGSYAFRWYPSGLAGEYWPYGTSSSVTFTVKSTTSVGSEATWGVFPQSPFTTSTLVYGDDNVTFAKQY
ncbi:MAG: hypothetical protein ICV83_20435 [Cytophagales bacterium]|nr:hypothetical protein [Cytophagales bacterium]